jgi:hypothetical protein
MYEVKLDQESLRRVLAMAKEAGPTVRRQVAKGIRTAAEPAAQAARDKVTSELPPKANQATGIRRILGRGRYRTRTRSTGLRANIARGVSIATRTSGRSAGVRIQASAKHLLPSQKNMPRTYNKPTFHHPVFGRGSVPQHGNPWFYKPIQDKKNEIGDAVLRALQAAAEELENL